MEYLTPKEVFIIQARLVHHFGGDIHLKNPALLRVIANRPKMVIGGGGKEAIFLKAGRMKLDGEQYRPFRRNHPLLGWLLTMRFLTKNGVDLPKTDLRVWWEARWNPFRN